MAAITNQAAAASTLRLGNPQRGEIIRKIIVYALLIFLSGLFLFPLFWMITTALKPESQIFQWPPQWLPSPIMWSNFKDAFSNPNLPFSIFIGNTLLIYMGVVTRRFISNSL